jgi:hypothetical protein
MGLTRLCTLCADVDRSSLDSPFYACAFRRKLYYSLGYRSRGGIASLTDVGSPRSPAKRLSALGYAP